MRNVLNARTSAIREDARGKLPTWSSRNLPRRGQIFYPVGPSAQIAIRRKRIGAWNVIGRASSNSIHEKGRKLTKWHKAEGRLLIPDTDGRAGRTVDTEALAISEEGAEQLERNLPMQQRQTAPADDDLPIHAR